MAFSEYINFNSLSENWAVKKSQSTHHRSQLSNVTDTWHNGAELHHLDFKYFCKPCSKSDVLTNLATFWNQQTYRIDDDVHES